MPDAAYSPSAQQSAPRGEKRLEVPAVGNKDVKTLVSGEAGDGARFSGGDRHRFLDQDMDAPCQRCDRVGAMQAMGEATTSASIGASSNIAAKSSEA